MKDIFSELYKKVIGFFNSESKEENSKETACNRLKLVLMQDRAKMEPALMEKMREEMIAVISKYVEIDKEALDLNLEAEGESFALMLNIPVIRAKTREEVEEAEGIDIEEEEDDDDDDAEDEDEDEDEADSGQEVKDEKIVAESSEEVEVSADVELEESESDNSDVENQDENPDYEDSTDGKTTKETDNRVSSEGDPIIQAPLMKNKQKKNKQK